MAGYREFSPDDPFPSDYPNALGEFLSIAVENFLLIIKPSDATVLQVPASADNGRAAISIGGKWRYVDANVERASPGGAPTTFDVYVTASDNAFASDEDGEVDSTVYAFALAIMASGDTPGGVALYRKVGSAPWDGGKFTAVDVIVGAQAGGPRHASSHATGGDDPVTPAAIGAATEADLEAEVARAEAAEPTAGELAALAGTNGAPGAGNKFVTTSDPRNTNVRTPTAHAASHDPGGSDALQVTGWTGITFTGNWDAALYGAEFQRDALGFEHIHGSATKSTTPVVGDLLGTLPAGSRSGHPESFGVLVKDSSGTLHSCRLLISQDGTIVLEEPAGAFAAGAATLYFGAISFVQVN